MTYFADSDSNGNIIAYYTDLLDYNNGIPKTAIPLTDAQWLDSHTNQGKYIVQNGALVLAPPPSNDQQLSNAKTERIAYLNKQFGATLLNGFTSSADGTSRTYAIDPVALARWTGTLSNMNSGKVTQATIKDFNGNKLTLTVAQFQQMAADGFNFYESQEQNLWTKEDDVNAIQLANYATLSDAINAVNAVTY